MEKKLTLWPGGPSFDPGALGVSSDSVLLADFVPEGRYAACADLGCGAGLILLLLGTRFPEMRLFGVERVPEWAALCRENLRTNGFSDRAEITAGDLRAYSPGRFPLVVSNPPYFPVGSGRQADDPLLASARSEKSCTLEELCRAASGLLMHGGRFCLVHRAERLAELFETLKRHTLEPKRLRLVQHNAEAPASLALLEARKGGRPGLAVLPALLLTDPDGGDSGELRRICHRE